MTAHLGTANGPDHRNNAAMTAPAMPIRLTIAKPPVAGEESYNLTQQRSGAKEPTAGEGA
jgi:hypothetical protein